MALILFLSMQFKREIESFIKKMATEFPLLVITGARQVGKTTLVKQLFPEHRYITLDIPSVANFAEIDTDLFLKKYPPPLIIDEVQYAPGIFRNLKLWVDTHREFKGQIILTGSQKFNLMKEVAESLAGRIGLIELEPLSLFELKGSLEIKNDMVAEVFERGFYPELWKERSRTPSFYYQSYLGTYLERDVRQLLHVGNLLDFEKLLRLLATRVGQTLEKSALARDVGIKVNTLNSWLSVLEASNQIVFLQPYFENFGTRLVKSPKFYFSDIGLALNLLGLDGKAALNSPLLGSLWENLIFMELRKRNLCRIRPGQFWFYRDSSAREVDFLFVDKGQVHFIESKWTAQPEKKSALIIESVADALKSKAVRAGDCFVISRAEVPYSLTSRTRAYSILDFELPSA